jgi:MATE family multidrug resistance protein
VSLADLRAVLRVGLPIGIATLAELGIYLAATLYAGAVGTADVAAHTLTLRAAGVVYAVPLALLQAAMVRSARAETLGNPDLRQATTRAALLLSLACGVCVLAALLAVASPLATAVLGTGPAVAATVDLAAGLLVLLAWMELFAIPGCAAAGLLRGRKDSRAPMVASLVGYWVIAAPVGLWVAERHDLGVAGIWLGLAAGSLVTSGLTLARLATVKGPTRTPG